MYLVPTVLEKTSQGERSFDLYSRLMRDRIILLNGEIREEMSNIIVAQLLYLESEDPQRDILLYINSIGGSVTAGMAIYDTMQFVKCDVSTIVNGEACSMGSLLACAGTKGKRLMLPHATHMVHQPLGGAKGQATDVLIQAKELERWKTVLTEIYSLHTGLTMSELIPALERDNYKDAKASIAFGLADKIITKRE